MSNAASAVKANNAMKTIAAARSHIYDVANMQDSKDDNEFVSDLANGVFLEKAALYLHKRRADSTGHDASMAPVVGLDPPQCETRFSK